MADVRAGFPTWTVSEGVDPGNPFVEGLRGLTCPRCGQVFFVFVEEWLDADGETRACCYCFRASKVPDDLEEVRHMEREPDEQEQKQERMEEASSEDRGFTEDPEQTEAAEEDSPADGEEEDADS